MDVSPFHADELAAQARAGVRAGGAGIRNALTDEHRRFFAAMTHIYVAAVDARGWPLATLLEGEPGFVQSPDPATLRIAAVPRPDDPAAGAIRSGSVIGVLGLDLETRRRNRANGVVADAQGGITVAVTQSFGNCPQYIQHRALGHAGTVAGPVRSFTSLDDGDARALIGRADTFFVASRSREGVGPAGGADISHRGGRPGFVHLHEATLTVPDFRGNRYFNTLGNLLGEPRASLLFADFESGDLLQLQGRGEVDWDAPAAGLTEGAERIWRFEVARGWYRPRALGFRGALVEYSPATLRTGSWPRAD